MRATLVDKGIMNLMIGQNAKEEQLLYWQKLYNRLLTPSVDSEPRSDR